MPRYSIIKWANTSDKTIKQRRKRNLMYRRHKSTEKTQPKLALLDHLYITCELIGYKIKIDIVLKYDYN